VFEAAWNLVTGIRIHADRQRLAQALSLPEYMETWLDIPNAAPGSVRVTRNEAEYDIQCLASDSTPVRIHGTYRAVRSTRVVFTWRKDTAGSSVESLVRVALSGDFAYTRLLLSHMGLTSEREYQWHREVWHNSLARLSRLYA
jgi:hypothetical protein